MVWYGTVRYGVVWYGMVLNCTVWCGSGVVLVWYDVVYIWYGMVYMVWYSIYGMVERRMFQKGLFHGKALASRSTYVGVWLVGWLFWALGPRGGAEGGGEGIAPHFEICM